MGVVKRGEERSHRVTCTHKHERTNNEEVNHWIRIIKQAAKPLHRRGIPNLY